MPALFVGHGSPMNAIEDNDWTRGWEDVAREIPRPKAILCISAHWETQDLAVTADARPKTIHDFGGFPKALFDIQYPAPGSPELAARIPDITSIDTRQALDWGLDHGAWSVLCCMYPEADVPVVQLSLDRRLGARWHYEIGSRLAPLREEGVLVMGSGNIVHNLRAIDFRNPAPLPWAQRFRDEANALIAARRHEALVQYETLGEDAVLSINSAEHYLPLLYVLALQRPDETARLFNDDVFAAISMTSVLIS
ncbi:MAG TPA: 4,5-DOPA dioxygenase extradiol [Caulobacteraceae bacterium]|nr:4,5-DOPA dioxygenase extradiol [Caulobacteraceae bacterium]